MSISLNYTSFVHSATATNIVEAMQKCLAEGTTERLVNRKGQAWLLVTIHKGNLGYAFKFITQDGHDVRHMIERASNNWTPGQLAAFWRMLSTAWDLVEHPLLTIRKMAIQIEALKAQGVTTEFMTYGGHKFYGGIQRDWLCRKRIYVFDQTTGEFVKLAKEALPMIASSRTL